MNTITPSSSLSIVHRLHTPTFVSGLAESISFQLKTGITLGLLQQGEKLPSEEELARYFLVSSLTLRQGLDRLRVEGLIQTKAGRGGGSFIAVSPQQLEELSSQALQQVSLNHISALGLSTAALFAEAARAAALRHDHYDRLTLESTLQLVVEATDPASRNRALTIFVINVAATARSERLMTTLTPLIGELQSMSWLAGDDDVAGIAQRAQNVITAIMDSDEKSARDSARLLIRSLTQLLLDARTTGAAQPLMDSAQEQGEAVVAGFRKLMGELAQIRDALAEAATTLVEIPLPVRGQKGASAQIDHVLQNIVMDQPQDMVRGAGVAYAPGLFEVSRLAIDWWDVGRNPLQPYREHEFNRPSFQYYQYDRLPWFTRPLSSGSFAAYGPYIDRGGIEELIVTVSLPVEQAPYTGSVLGADLRIEELEQVFMVPPSAVPGTPRYVLLTDESRVVASTTEEFTPGMVPSVEQLQHFEPLTDRSDDVVGLGWQVVKYVAGSQPALATVGAS